MAMHLITGHAETAHISAADAGALNACTIGAGSYVFEYGDELKAVMTTANKVTIGTGALMHQGRQALVGTATDLTVESGTQAQKRNDLVVARYTKTGDVDDMHLAVVKGTPVSYGDPSDPVLEDGNILDGATVSEMPLWRIPLDGISVGEPEKLFETVPSIDSLRETVSRTPVTVIVDSKWGEVSVWSFGPVVCFSAWWTSPTDVWGSEIIATLPEDMKPAQNVDFPMYRNDDTGYGNVSIFFETSGSVIIRGHGGIGHQGDYMSAAGCWITAR